VFKRDLESRIADVAVTQEALNKHLEEPQPELDNITLSFTVLPIIFSATIQDFFLTNEPFLQKQNPKRLHPLPNTSKT
jgi:hypothetical protein